MVFLEITSQSCGLAGVFSMEPRGLKVAVSGGNFFSALLPSRDSNLRPTHKLVVQLQGAGAADVGGDHGHDDLQRAGLCQREG